MKDLVCKEPEKWTSPLPCGGGKCGKGESEQEGEYFSCKEESAHSFFRVKDDAFWNEVEHPVSFQQLMWNCLPGEARLRGNGLYQPWEERWLPALTRRRPSFQQSESGSFCLIEDGAWEPEEEELEKVLRRASEQTKSDEMFSGNGLCLFVWKAMNTIA